MRRCRPPRTVARCGTRPGASSPSERCRSRSGTESGTAIKQAALVRNAAAAGTTPTDLARGGSLKCTLLNGARDRADDHGRSGPAFCCSQFDQDGRWTAIKMAVGAQGSWLHSVDDNGVFTAADQPVAGDAVRSGDQVLQRTGCGVELDVIHDPQFSPGVGEQSLADYLGFFDAEFAGRFAGGHDDGLGWHGHRIGAEGGQVIPAQSVSVHGCLAQSERDDPLACGADDEPRDEADGARTFGADHWPSGGLAEQCHVVARRRARKASTAAPNSAKSPETNSIAASGTMSASPETDRVSGSGIRR